MGARVDRLREEGSWDSEEKHEPTSDNGSAVVDSLKALDPNRPMIAVRALNYDHSGHQAQGRSRTPLMGQSVDSLRMASTFFSAFPMPRRSSEDFAAQPPQPVSAGGLRWMQRDLKVTVRRLPALERLLHRRTSMSTVSISTFHNRWRRPTKKSVIVWIHGRGTANQTTMPIPAVTRRFFVYQIGRERNIYRRKLIAASALSSTPRMLCAGNSRDAHIMSLRLNR